MPIERQGTQKDLDQLPAFVIGFPIRTPAAPADTPETPDSEHGESSDEAAEGGRDG
jgi:hypothetical protein